MGAVEGRTSPRAALPFRLGVFVLALGFAAVIAGSALLSLPVWGIFLVSFVSLLVVGLARRSVRPELPAQAKGYGQYRLVRKLGEGGMGVVYEASHALLRRPTALKLVRSFGEQDPKARHEALKRFEREVQLTSQLSHPNTIVIYDYGPSPDGGFYYAMEYIDGVDLERLVRVDGPLHPARVIHLALQVCGSLAEAHAKALIHRDIKPGNLFVYERAGVPDTVKVLDFGLVKSLHGPVLSAAHVVVGTPLYMAPEVMRDPGRASSRSDIYSLGAVLHWLVTGKTLQESALLGITPGAPAVPVDLERLIGRCTEADPADRPESMEQLADELRQCQSHGAWTEALAREYWQAHGKRLSMVLSEPARPSADTLAAS
jgi:serine/threonine protein kinase